MSRTVPTVVVLVLLALTAVAFVETERLKLKPSPVTKVAVTKVFSPTCECDNKTAVIAFRLRKPGRLTVSVMGSHSRLEWSSGGALGGLGDFGSEASTV